MGGVNASQHKLATVRGVGVPGQQMEVVQHGFKKEMSVSSTRCITIIRVQESLDGGGKVTAGEKHGRWVGSATT
jgi:hypothetical protein